MENENQHQELEQWNTLANELEELNAKENQGRGLTVIRDIIIFLRLGRVADARHIAEWDHDKILDALKTHETIRTLLKEKLFAGIEHPWKMMDEFYERQAKEKGKIKKKRVQ